uniref:Uncharacterized protein n=1 Tax=Arundo donax TaxID=35708 RepID=A0A0A8YU48_ARUDO
MVENGDAAADLDEKIWKHLPESSCSFFSQPLTDLHYE